jgi:hypothetical protein
MRKANSLFAATLLMCACTGCYKELPPEEAQAPAHPAPVAQPVEAKTAQTGGHSVGDTGNASLGAAKRSATNIVHQAEQQSQRTADENTPPNER